MSQSTTVLAQKRRGPKPTGKGILVGVRLQPDLLAEVDRFVNSEMKRPEVIRFILNDWFMSRER